MAAGHEGGAATGGPAAAGRRLNLGAGRRKLPGYENLDGADGDVIHPLAVPDGACAEIRASHVLEHFPHGQIAAVLADWARALAPGGILKIAVPDFQVIAERYLAGDALPVQGYVMGGQIDARDYHRAIFDRDELERAMRAAGLIAIRRWSSEADDCAALPISLNLMGTKPAAEPPVIKAVMSVPRLGFMDNFFCATEALVPAGIGLSLVQGAFWNQCLTRGIENAIGAGAEFVLTIDYDTVFTAADVSRLAQIMAACPWIDALAPLQSARHHAHPLLTRKGADGAPATEIEFDEMADDIMPAETAHFGLTLLRDSALARLPKPWLHGQPDASGGWGEGRVDDDVAFWRAWRAAGLSLFVANRVAVGHAELLIRWPGRDLSAVLQYPRDFREKGKPAECWE